MLLPKHLPPMTASIVECKVTHKGLFPLTLTFPGSNGEWFMSASTSSNANLSVLLPQTLSFPV